MRRQINELISEKNLLEIKIQNMEAEKQYSKHNHQTKVFDGEGGSLRHEYNMLKYELK